MNSTRPSNYIRTVAAAFLVLVSVSLTACEPESKTADAPAAPKLSFKNTDISGINYAKDFSLTDHNGVPRKLADFRGKVVVIFFGFTQCPDICPTTLADMSAAMKKLGAQADKVQVLFVTLDPARDSQELLASYVPNFDSRFLGLRGDVAATNKVAQEFKVFYQKNAGKTPESYTIDHTAASYVFDPQGRIRLYVRNGQKVDAIVSDIAQLLQ
jgi:protein SCO1